MPPRLPGKRSNKLAQRIIAIPEKQRTMLQRRMLAAHERGECTGCNQYGEPLAVDGKELPVTREANGFAAPAEFCDCVAGVSFQKRVEKQREEYRQQDIRIRQTYAQRLFGLPDVNPPPRGGTLGTWPVVLERQEDMDEDMYIRAVGQREFLVELLRYYADHLYFESADRLRRGLCLIGAPGVGKTGLIRCIEPLLAKRGHYMLSLYVPELLRLVKHSAQAEEMIKVMKMVEVLFLDDLGNPLAAEPVSAEVHSFFACIFDERLKHNRPTLITTNLDEDMLEAQFGEYILSRIQGLCHMYIVPGIDLR
jgi:DNA replication protein DnaC